MCHILAAFVNTNIHLEKLLVWCHMWTPTQNRSRLQKEHVVCNTAALVDRCSLSPRHMDRGMDRHPVGCVRVEFFLRSITSIPMWLDCRYRLNRAGSIVKMFLFVCMCVCGAYRCVCPHTYVCCLRKYVHLCAQL